MKRFAWLLFALFATGARAEMLPNAGEYVWGDNLRDLIVDAADGSAAFDLTGATLVLYASTEIAGRTYTFTAPGDIVNAATGTMRFEDLGTLARNPGARGRDLYWARVKVTKNGESGWTSPLRFSVVKFPQ